MPQNFVEVGELKNMRVFPMRPFYDDFMYNNGSQKSFVCGGLPLYKT